MRRFAIPAIGFAVLGCMTHQHLGSVADDAAPPDPADAPAWQATDGRNDRIWTSRCTRDVDCTVRWMGGAFDCSEASACTVTCEGDCRVACGTAPCSLSCPMGARCELQCSLSPPQSCADGRLVCNGAPC